MVSKNTSEVSWMVVLLAECNALSTFVVYPRLRSGSSFLEILM